MAQLMRALGKDDFFPNRGFVINPQRYHEYLCVGQGYKELFLRTRFKSLEGGGYLKVLSSFGFF